MRCYITLQNNSNRWQNITVIGVSKTEDMKLVPHEQCLVGFLADEDNITHGPQIDMKIENGSIILNLAHAARGKPWVRFRDRDDEI